MLCLSNIIFLYSLFSHHNFSLTFSFFERNTAASITNTASTIDIATKMSNITYGPSIELLAALLQGQNGF